MNCSCSVVHFTPELIYFINGNLHLWVPLLMLPILCFLPLIKTNFFLMSFNSFWLNLGGLVLFQIVLVTEHMVLILLNLSYFSKQKCPEGPSVLFKKIKAAFLFFMCEFNLFVWIIIYHTFYPCTQSYKLKLFLYLIIVNNAIINMRVPNIISK